MSRVVMDAVNIETGEAIYFNSHAKATYLSDGRNVESALTKIDGDVKNRNVSAVEHVSVDDAETYVTNADLDKIINNINNALDRIIGVDEEGTEEGIEGTEGTFSIQLRNGFIHTYQFEIGMTWSEYMNSEYKHIDIEYYSSSIAYGSGTSRYLFGAEDNDLIVNNHTYVVGEVIGGPQHGGGSN